MPSTTAIVLLALFLIERSAGLPAHSKNVFLEGNDVISTVQNQRRGPDNRLAAVAPSTPTTAVNFVLWSRPASLFRNVFPSIERYDKCIGNPFYCLKRAVSKPRDNFATKTVRVNTRAYLPICTGEIVFERCNILLLENRAI